MKKLLLLMTLCSAVAIGAPTLRIDAVSTSTTAARSVNIGAGMPIVMWCTVATSFIFGNSTVTATVATAVPLEASKVWTDVTQVGATYISFITSSGSGTCYIFYDK